MKTIFLFCFPGEKSFEHFVPSPQKTGLIKLINQIRFWVSRIACVVGWAFLLILEIFDVAADWELGCILPLWLISFHSVSLQCLRYFISTADLAEIGHLLFSPFLPDSLPQCYSPLATGRWAEQMRQHPPLASSPPSEAVGLCNILFILSPSDSPSFQVLIQRGSCEGFSFALLIFQHGNECSNSIFSPPFLAFLGDIMLLTFTFCLVISLVFLEQVFKSLLLIQLFFFFSGLCCLCIQLEGELILVAEKKLF